MVQQAVDKLIEALQADYDARSGNGNAATRTVFSSVKGRKYIKVVHRYNSSKEGDYSVHCFVDAQTGDVFKPASWSAPAKGVRYNLLRNPEACYQKADWSGSYLYRRG